MNIRHSRLIPDAFVTLLFAALIISLLQPALISSPELPTGGDTASQLFYAWIFTHEILPSGRVTAWMPEVFGGFPLLSYYFPLPFVATTALSLVMGFAAAFKWVLVLPVILLPGTVFTVSRHLLKFGWLAAFCGALGCFAFLLHEQNSIWGGNLLATLVGEFAYSWGMWFSFMTLALWVRVVRQGTNWMGVAILEALTGLCHGYPLLVTGFASLFLLLDSDQRRRTFWLLAKGHLFAFALLGGWLWPLLEMHGYTIPNDTSAHIKAWTELLPKTLWPVLGVGLLALILLAIPRLRRGIAPEHTHSLCFFSVAAALSGCAWLAAARVGLADVRFFPFVWFFGSVVCGWLVGLLLANLAVTKQSVIAAALLCGSLGWIGPLVLQVPDWALWNYIGLVSKPQWEVLSKLFPNMSGRLDSPRLLFEYSPANGDLGSTRVLETLPMYLGGRPVLEGLYMESAVLGPAVYQLQSEVSISPLSPLSRFPSGNLDAEMAARHMQMLHVSEVLVRSPQARKALLESTLFDVAAESPPFTLLRLKEFEPQLVDASIHQWKLGSRANWMQDSYAWFRSRARLDREWPVYGSGGNSGAFHANSLHKPAVIRQVKMGRDSISFTTSSPDQPHLIKVAYHPRWQLKTKGQIYLAAPGFLLVVPAEKSVSLIYGTTWIGRVGEAASVLSLCYMLFKLVGRRRYATTTREEVVVLVSTKNWLAGGGALIVLGLWLHMTSADRIYYSGWEEMNAHHYKAAGELFSKAYQRRYSPAAREEALFWSAKAIELSGDDQEAVRRYHELMDHYAGYWLPESLYTYAIINRKLGNLPVAQASENRLRSEYPKNSWAQKVVTDPSNHH